MKMSDEECNKLRDARIKGETQRVVENLMARTEPVKSSWWLSFADENGFRGVVIVDAADFVEAVLICNMKKINPHGEIAGMHIEDGTIIPPKWKNRILSREDCEQHEKEMIEIINGLRDITPGN